MEILNNVLLVLCIVAILYIWFDTDAFVEWAQLLRLKFLKYQAYHEAKKAALGAVITSYPKYLLFKYQKYFLIRLLACPICLSVWLNVLATLIFQSQTGGWKYIGFNVIVAWSLYYTLRDLLAKLNERGY